mmetsp:Transcript_88921/g.247463  ORF Transcript_88921/g.247463 Transcript_88921/m.247463 type:complete len:277 (+) Transcript_88921:246-1076(+)
MAGQVPVLARRPRPRLQQGLRDVPPPPRRPRASRRLRAAGGAGNVDAGAAARAARAEAVGAEGGAEGGAGRQGGEHGPAEDASGEQLWPHGPRVDGLVERPSCRSGHESNGAAVRRDGRRLPRRGARGALLDRGGCTELRTARRCAIPGLAALVRNAGRTRAPFRCRRSVSRAIGATPAGRAAAARCSLSSYRSELSAPPPASSAAEGSQCAQHVASSAIVALACPPIGQRGSAGPLLLVIRREPRLMVRPRCSVWALETACGREQRHSHVTPEKM